MLFQPHDRRIFTSGRCAEDHARETNGVVTAAISARYQSTSGATSLDINGFDGTAWYTLNVPFTIQAAPLSLTTSLMFSNWDSTSHKAGTASINAATVGGTAPFTYTWTVNGTPTLGSYVLSTPVSSSPLALTLTVTDSSPVPQTATKSLTIPAAPMLSEALLHAAVLRHVAALNDFAAVLAAQGVDNSYIAGLVQSQSGMTAAQYAQISARATSYTSAVAAANASYASQTRALHAQGLTAKDATGSTLAALQTTAGTASALPATWLGYLQADLGTSGFNQLDTYAWNNVAPLLRGCEEVCEGQDIRFSVYTDIEIDPGSGAIYGVATAQVSGFDVTHFDEPEIRFDYVAMDGASSYVESGYSGFEEEVTVQGSASQPGAYKISAAATATGDLYGLTWLARRK